VLGVIGAGGLGYQVFLSLQSLKYNELWTLFYALALLSGLTDLWSSQLRGALQGTARTNLCVDVACGDPGKLRAWENGSTRWQWALRKVSLPLFVIIVLLSLFYLRLDISIMWQPRTQILLTEIVGDLFPPRTADIAGLVYIVGQTLAMSILAMVIATVFGLLLALPAARNLALPPEAQGLTRWLGMGALLISRGLLLFLRAIPPSIWALVVMFVMFPGILPGAVALGIYTTGILGRLMAETIENLDERPMRALKTAGGRWLSVFFYSTLPAALPRFLTYILYRWEVGVRETVIVGLVGAGGLGRLLSEQLAAFDYRAITTTLIAMAILTFGVDLVSSSVRRSVR
jgi:phosphonate transport system permease protein